MSGRRIILVGASGAGKTTLLQRLRGEELSYGKTQAVTYLDSFIDTPGEYSENRWMRGNLSIASADAELVGMVQCATDTQAVYTEGYRYFFQVPVIGIITKIDHEEANVGYAHELLEIAGAEKIVAVSAFTGEGVDELAELFETYEDYDV